MTEWGVVAVIIALVGLIATIVKPMLNLNTSIVQLTTQLQDVLKSFDDFKIRYTDNLKFLKHTDEHLQEQIARPETEQ